MIPGPDNLDLGALQDDVAVLKQDIAILIEDVKMTVTDMARDVVEQINEQAQRLLRCAGKECRRPLGDLGRHVETRPVVSVLVVFGAGFVASRFLGR